jgi:beta-mannosidase
MELTDGWRALEATDALRRDYYRTDLDDRTWEPVTVPGHWRSHAAFSNSDGPLLHRCRFSSPPPDDGRRAWLTYDGIFYQGDHWLDGDYLGDTEGYFMPHTFEVTDLMRARSEHLLASEIACSPQRDKSAKTNITGVFQHWDLIDPDSNPGGIWRPVRLTETGPVRIQSLRVLCREATPQRAVLSFHAVLDSDAVRTVRLQTTVGEGLDHAAEHPLAAGENTIDWTVAVERPDLWWPHALGAPTLYDVRVAVHVRRATDAEPHDNGRSPQPGDGDVLSDERTVRTGLRSLSMRNWIWSVNGEQLFLKGSNLGPSRYDLGYAMGEELRRDVELATDTGLDFLRIHAHISRPELYEAADETGLLLWQDFPLQWGYARGIRRQAITQSRAAVDLLGHHPSIALWCAHNEPMSIEDPEMRGSVLQKAALGVKALAQQQLPTWNKTLLDGSLKRSFTAADGTRPVVAHSGVLPHPPRFDGTDAHLYFGWYWGEERSFAAFCKAWPRLARFVTEFGAQAVPSGDGADWMDPGRWPYLDWDRLKHTHGLQKTYFDRYVPPIDYATFDAWRDATQRYQATVVKHHIETLRRLKYRPAGGFAQFCLADCLPMVSWAVLDHERRPKQAYDALRAACRPVIVVADRLPEHARTGAELDLDVHVVSDRRDPIVGAVTTATLSWMGGHKTTSWSGDVPADACSRVGRLHAVLPDTPGQLALDLTLSLPDGEVVANRYESSMT